MSILPMCAFAYKVKPYICLYEKTKKKCYIKIILSNPFLFPISYCHCTQTDTLSLHVVGMLAHRNNELIWQKVSFYICISSMLSNLFHLLFFFALFRFGSLTICPSSMKTTYNDVLIYATCISHWNWKTSNEKKKSMTILIGISHRITVCNNIRY